MIEVSPYSHLGKYICEITFGADFLQLDITLIGNLVHKVKPDINFLNMVMIDLVLYQIACVHAVMMDFQKKSCSIPKSANSP